MSAILRVFVAAVVSAGSFAVPGLPAEAGPGGPHIVLITFDTLRADHLGCYGYPRPTSPWVDALAARGARFERAYSTSSWTPPSMATIMTSLYPRDHGVTHGLVSTSHVIEQEVLSDTLRTLAELLSEHGYRTFGISTTAHLTAGQGFGQGFDRFKYIRFDSARNVRDVLREWKLQIVSCRRAFLWIHLFDPHDPYVPHAPWAYQFKPDLAQIGEIRLRGTLKSIREWWAEGGLPADPGHPYVESLRAAYDSEIRFADEELASMFSDLDLGPNTLTIVTADHGEAFFEHGHLGHGQNLHDELVRVPMIVAGPDSLRLRGLFASPVSLTDVLPTVLDFAGIPAPPGAAGRSLFDVIAGEREGRPDMDRTLYAEVWDQDPGRSTRVWKSLRRDRHKLMIRMGSDEVRLFDTVADPGETRDLSGDDPALRGRMLEELVAWIRQAPMGMRARTVPLDDEARERLRSLGYIND
jgi:arylsulfatase A-like enzyme